MSLERELLVKLLNELSRNGCSNHKCKSNGSHVDSCEWLRAVGEARRRLSAYDVRRCVRPVRKESGPRLRLVRPKKNDASEDLG